MDLSGQTDPSMFQGPLRPWGRPVFLSMCSMCCESPDGWGEGSGVDEGGQASVLSDWLCGDGPRTQGEHRSQLGHRRPPQPWGRRLHQPRLAGWGLGLPQPVTAPSPGGPHHLEVLYSCRDSSLAVETPRSLPTLTLSKQSMRSTSSVS